MLKVPTAANRGRGSSPASRLLEQLEGNRRAAVRASGDLGTRKLLVALKRAQLKLEARLPTIGPNAKFTRAAQEQSLHQLRAVVNGVRDAKGKVLVRGLRDDVEAAVRGQASAAAKLGARATLDYMLAAEKAYTGVSMLGPRLQEAVQLDVAVAGADASVLRRVATDAGYRGEAAQAGVMSRYGIGVVNGFEKVMQDGLLSNASWGEMRGALTEESAWLQDSPLYWSERILRTEVMGAVNRAGQATMEQCEEVAGETLQILIATFDDRTAADSYAVHGQVRRLGESFDTWQGPCSVPPARPNDRETVVPHMREWPLPPELMPLPDEAVAQRWAEQTRSKKHPEGRPGMPPRPLMSTVAGFGIVT